MFVDDTKAKCFLSLAKTLNFTKTAEQVFMTQQNVSHNIAALEKELQLQLFIRSTRSVKLTEEGREFYEYLSGAEAEYRAVLNKLQKQQNPHKIRVGYQNFISYFNKLKIAMNDIHDDFPSLTMEGNRYSPAVLKQMLENNELDTIVIYRRFVSQPEKYNILPLCKINQFYMISPDTEIPEGEDELTFIRRQPFIVDYVEHEQPKEMNQRVKDEYEKYGFTGQTMVSPDRDSAYTYAEMGYGVVVGTDISVMSANRALRKIKCNEEELVIIWKKEDDSALITAFANAVQKAFQSVHI